MVQKLLKYLLVLGVALTGFQLNAYADDEKDKDKSKDKTLNSNVSAKDSIIIKVSDDDVSVGDTLVFDDYDDDEGSNGNSNSLVAKGKDTNSVNVKTISCLSRVACGFRIPKEELVRYIHVLPSTEDDSFTPSTDGTSYGSTESASLSMKVFPNPANADNQPITIEHNLSTEADIKIFNLDGKLIKQLFSTSKQTIVSDLPTGFYLVNITSNDQSASSRLIVK